VLGRIRKALVAGVGAALSAYVAASAQKGGVPGTAELAVAVVAGLVVAWGVWRAPNKPPTAS